MRSMNDRPTLLEVFTIGMFLMVFGILGIASSIYKFLNKRGLRCRNYSWKV